MNDLIRRPWNARLPRRRSKLMPWHLRLYISRRGRLPRAQRLSVGDDLLRNCDVRVGRRKPTRTIQQCLGKPDR